MVEGYKEVTNLSILRGIGELVVKNIDSHVPTNIGIRLYVKNTLDHYSDKPLYGGVENTDSEIIEYLKTNKHRISGLDMRKSVSFVLELPRLLHSPVVIYIV